MVSIGSKRRKRSSSNNNKMKQQSSTSNMMMMSHSSQDTVYFLVSLLLFMVSLTSSFGYYYCTGTCNGFNSIVHNRVSSIHSTTGTTSRSIKPIPTDTSCTTLTFISSTNPKTRYVQQQQCQQQRHSLLYRTTTAIKTTRLLFSSSYNNNNDDYMASLQRRIEQVTTKETTIPIAVIDTMVPRQVLKLQVSYDDDKQFYMLLTKLLTKDTASPTFGMIGIAKIQGSSGQYVPLQNGVLVEIIKEDDPIVVVQDSSTDTSSTSSTSSNTINSSSSSSSKSSTVLPKLNIKLRGTKRFRIISSPVQSNDGEWNEAKVQYLNSIDEEELEKQNIETTKNYSLAIQRCKELTIPNMNMPNQQSLVETWIQLARQNEHFSGQIDQLLIDIGPIPHYTQPTECSFWIGALINPLPGMGVALEIRPLLLMSNNSYERINIAVSSIYASIKHMDGTKRLF
jgi:hypothetical protein